MGVLSSLPARNVWGVCNCACVQPVPTEQSSVFAGRNGVAPTVPVAVGSVQPSALAPTVPVDVPSCQETKEAFQEVSTAF